ncbi:MAG: glycosyltransferase family 2 protein [Thermoguttaceae bacterium]|jgi:glycosyltransferase involved in cell wall biosynthesis
MDTLKTPFDAPARQAPSRGAGDTRVAVVVPLYNEEDSLPRLAEMLEGLARTAPPGYAIEFILVDDGSSDGTRQRALALFGGRPNYLLLSHPRNRGIAAAIMTGLRRASADVLCSIDADCTYQPRLLLRMIPRLCEGVDLVTASPYHPHGGVCNIPAWRVGISRAASALYRRLLHNKLSCYTCCVRVYRPSAVCALQLRRGGFAGIPELLWRLDRNGSRMCEEPAVLEARRSGSSKLRLLPVIARHLGLLAEILRARVRDRFRAARAPRQPLAAARRRDVSRALPVGIPASAGDLPRPLTHKELT